MVSASLAARTIAVPRRPAPSADSAGVAYQCDGRCSEGTDPDRSFASVFVTAPDGLRLHIRPYEKPRKSSS